MAKVIVRSDEVAGKEKLTLKNVTSIYVTNKALIPLEFFLNGIKRNIPSYNPSVYVIPPVFEISFHGHYVDSIDLDFRQEDTSVIVDYSVLVEQENQSC